ncbi:type II secretion system inner membrane protein GspF [Aquisalinus flavus]|uniref:General secretion pathway protein F n=1 Tax=Aquisalinus flavus TaxID=1526572 RepID=A0A8J2Y699_9PROT|nr:type II secretion system inner membrane protein GspF [Aquisalinus flavus]MBD0427321.1 type II secretion system inner membrane protein GspF [Aquisalinus flavus]UNE47127.1 type II secretion system protein GspF [Aquisalinus flavus]GGD00083.1 type II secretion system protein GspF [Aquisalinus flavus]
MAAFQYEALDQSGRKKKGMLSADSMRLARRELRDAGLTPLRIEAGAAETGSGQRQHPLSNSDVVMLTRQAATLIETATPVEEALNAVAAQMEKPRATLLAIRSRVMEGWRLSDALGEHPKSFSPLYRAIVAAGETSGDLGRVMSRLADMLEKNRAMAMKAITALIYPAVLMLVAVGVVTGLMIFVVPKIVDQFDTLGARLPLITRIVIGLSAFLQSWGLALLVLIVLGALGLWQGLRLPAIRLAFDRFVLRLPIVGKLSRGLDAARFGRTLSTLFASGAPLLECLQAARKTVVNTELRARLGETLTSVSEGTSLSAGLRKAGAFDPMMVYMVAAGERSGTLPAMLDRTASHMEAQFDNSTTLALRLLEPVIIVFMGLIVLAIVLAILVPILQLNTLAAA